MSEFNEFPYKSIEKIFGQDKFYIKLFKNLLYAVTYDDFSKLSSTPAELINEYKKIREKVEKFFKTQIYEYIYSSSAYDGLIAALIDIYSVYYTVAFLRKNISTLTLQPDEIIDNYLDSFGFPGKNLFNYIQKRKICEVVYWYLRRKGTPQVIIKLLNLIGFSYFYIADYQILEYKNIENEELYVDDVELLFNDEFDNHVFSNNLIYQEKLYDTDDDLFYNQISEYNEIYMEDPLCIINEQELNKEPNIIFPSQSSYYQLGIVSTYTELERIVQAFIYATLKKIKNNNYNHNLYTCNVKGYNNPTSFMGLILGFQYILSEYFGVCENDLFEPYDIKEIFDDKIKFDISKKHHSYEEELKINNHIITEYDGGNAISKEYEYLELNYNGGNCGLIFYEYDGGFGISNEIDYDLDLDGGNAGDIIIIYDGGDANSIEEDYIYQIYNEYDGGTADLLYYEYFRDGGYATTIVYDYHFNCGYAFNNYYVYEFNNAFAAYINNNEYNGGYADSKKFARKELNNGFFDENQILIYDNGYSFTNILPSIINFNFDYEIDFGDSNIPNNVKENEYNIEVNGEDSITRPNEIYFFNKEYDNGFANSFIFEEKDIDNFYRDNGYTYSQYDKGEIYRSELKDIYDSLGKFHVKTVAKTDWEKRFDTDIIIDQNGNIWDSKYIINKNFQFEDLYNFTFYKLKYPVFGWQKDIKNKELIDIMNEINNEVKNISLQKLKWLPDTPFRRENSLYANFINKNNIKTRKEEQLKNIYNTFYGLPIFGIYDDMMEYFINHDQSFKEYIDSIILTKEEREKLNKDNDSKKIARNFNNVLDLMNSILEAVEYFIFDNTGYMIPVRNIILSYKNIIYILNEFDKHYTPYHSKLLFPMIYWMIKDFPGDQVAVDDSNIINSYRESSLRDIVWRANHFTLNDVKPPEPYNPITDFNGSNNNMPHVPISYYHRDPIEFDREKIQKENPYIYSVGYDWRNLNNRNLIVRSNCLEPIYDWDPDHMQVSMESSIIDTIDICRPNHEILNEIYERELKLKARKMYIKSYMTIIIGNNMYNSYDIEHNLNSYNIFTDVFNIDTGLNIKYQIKRLSSNIINITFNNILSSKEKIKVLILAPHSTNDIPYDHLTTERYNISGNNYLNHFMILHDFKNKNIYFDVYNRITGEVINTPIRKVNDDIMYISFDNPPNKENHYKINLVDINEEFNNKLYPSDTLFMEYDINNVDINEEYIINHNFYTNNLIVRAYNKETLIDVDFNLTFINVNNLKIKFNNNINNNDNIKVIITAVLGVIDPKAIPLNNIAGFMGSFRGNNIDKEFYVYHNINSINTFEQIIDFKTGECVRVLIDRINENCIRISFRNPPKDNDRYIVYVFAPMNINSLTYPSTYLNTSLLQFKVLSALEINEINNGNSNDVQYAYITNGWSFKRLEEYDGQDSIAINPGKDINNYYSKIPQFKLNPKSKLKEISNGYAPDIYLPMNFSKDFNGGKAFTCDCEYCKAINETDYIIKHNIGNKNVVVQVYNKYYQKVDCYSQIIDNNHVLVSFKKPIPKCDYYNINILSIPDTSIPLQEYDNIKYNKKSFIGSYYKELPIKEKYEEIEKITINEYDGGYALTPEEKYLNVLDNGFADTLLILFKQNYDGGDAFTERICYYDTFTITHNLNTTIVIVNVFDNNTRETINCWVSINDKNNITVGFKEPPLKTDKYTVVVIGALPISDIDNYLENDVDDIDTYMQPHFNKEIITNISKKSSIHINTDSDFYDQPEEIANISNKKYNLQTYDHPVMREKIMIMHEIKNQYNNINTYASENIGFNKYKIMVNDKKFGKEAYIDIDYTTTTINTYETFKKNMGIN